MSDPGSADAPRAGRGRPGEGRTGRRALAAVLLWAVAATLAVLVAWRAVAAVEADAARTGVLSASEVTAQLAQAQASSTTPTPSGTVPSPSGVAPSASALPTDTGSPAPTTPAPAPTTGTSAGTSPGTSVGTSPGTAPGTAPSTPTTPAPQPPVETVRSWSVSGGTVAASCRGGTVALLYATPLDGWAVEVGSAGPEHVEVELSRESAETKVEVRCEGGVPVQQVEEHTGGESSSDD